MPYGHNSVYVEYRLLEGDPIRLHIRPFITFRIWMRNLHEASQPPFPLTVLDGRYEMHLCEGAPSLKLCIRPHCGQFMADTLMSPGCRIGWIATAAPNISRILQARDTLLWI